MCYIIRTQYVPRSKLSTSVKRINLLKPYEAKGTVSSESHTGHINAM